MAQYSRVQTAKSNQTGLETTLTAAMPGNVTSGNLLIAVVRAGANLAVPLSSVADTRGTTYNLIASTTGADPRLWMYWGLAPSTGANTVTATFSSAVSFPWLFTLEYSGNTASPADTGDDNRGTGTTDLTSASITTAETDELILVAASQDNFATYSAGTDFSLVDGAIGGGGNTYGGIQERIATGALLSGYTAHITSSVSNDFAVIFGAFKSTDGGVGGGGGGFNALLIMP